MDKIENLIKDFENKDIDFKTELSDSKKVAQLVVAFYNSRGGKIILGVDDNRNPIGLKNPQKQEHKFAQIIRHWCKLDNEPELKFVKYKNKDFIVIDCPKGKDSPYFVKGEYAPRVRIGSSNMSANKEEIARLYREGSSKSQDVYPVQNADIDDLDLDKIKEYFKESKLTQQLDDNYFFRLIEKEHFVSRKNPADKSNMEQDSYALNKVPNATHTLFKTKENSKLIPTITGIVLFGKHPSLELPHTIIRADRYKGLNVTMWIDRADIEGDAFEVIDEIKKFMLKNMRTSYTPKGFETQIKTEYPIDALKEAIINAVVHRDYHNRESILLKMFDDRIEIWSPGELLRPLTINQLDDLTYRPKSRNENIAGVFSRRKMMDKRGTGILRMNKFCDEWKLPHPEFKEQSGYFGIIFKNPDYYTKVPEIKISAGLNDRQKKALEHIKIRGKITNKEYRDICTINRVMAFRDLNDLVEKKIIEKIGKTGRWTHYILKR